MSITQRIPVARAVAAALGVIYLLVAVVGFWLTGFDWDREAKILIFAVNPFHNIIHLVIALSALAGCRSDRAASIVLLALGAVLSLVTVLGFVGWLPVLGMHHGIAEPDNFLHLVSAVIALVTGLLYGPPED